MAATKDVVQGSTHTVGSFERNEAVVVKTEAATEVSVISPGMTCGARRDIPKTAI